jgi:thioredoxin reductase
MTERSYEVVVVGAGPAGLSTALVLGRSRRRTLLVDGGAGRNAPAAGVHGMLGWDGSPDELRSAGLRQLRDYPDVDMRTGRLPKVAGRRDEFTVMFDDGAVVDARRIVLATGVAEDLPDVAGVAERWGRSVFGCPYCHAWEVRDRPLAVLATGGDEDAVFAAQLMQWSSEITLCTNGFDVADLHIARGRGVSVRTEEVRRIDGRDGGVEKVVFAAGVPLPCAAVFVHATTHQASELPGELGCAVLADGSVRVDDTGRTSVPGIYAVGDSARRQASPSGATSVVSAAATGFITATTVNQDLFLASLERSP